MSSFNSRYFDSKENTSDTINKEPLFDNIMTSNETNRDFQIYYHNKKNCDIPLPSISDLFHHLPPPQSNNVNWEGLGENLTRSISFGHLHLTKNRDQKSYRKSISLDCDLDSFYKESARFQDYTEDTQGMSIFNPRMNKLCESFNLDKQDELIKETHKLAERQRRKQMKELFEGLRELLPRNKLTKSSKWEILSQAIQYITYLEKRNYQLSDELALLKKSEYK